MKHEALTFTASYPYCLDDVIGLLLELPTRGRAGILSLADASNSLFALSVHDINRQVNEVWRMITTSTDR